MKKPREIKRLHLSRETLANLEKLEGAELEKVAGGSATTCKVPPHCTC